MIEAKKLVASLAVYSMDTFFGVPDSLLKSFCAYIDDHGDEGKHVIAANEGNAIGMAAGYHMSTGKRAVVYMQNSGLGNAINPLTSIADKEVCQTPMLLLIGWRGEPSAKDEPQHVKQGRITPALLNTLEIPYRILDASSDTDQLASWASQCMDSSNAPVAILVCKSSFAPYASRRKPLTNSTLMRESALELLLQLAGDSAIISTTGITSREVFELRANKEEIQRDFLTIGGMGHSASIALGVALGQPGKRIVCLDGDGSVLMHMGALAIIGNLKPDNFIHVLLNNAAHESVGGQPTVANNINFELLAHACGYNSYARATSELEIEKAWKKLQKQTGPVMLEVCIKIGSRNNLGRPTVTPAQNKKAFMEWLV